MPDGMYHTCALIPLTTDFSLLRAVAHFQSLGLRAELTGGGDGFRVHYGDWAVDAWYDEGSKVLRDSAELAGGPFLPLPAPAEVIASCDRDLSLWSDPDPEFTHTTDWMDYVDELLKAFPGVVTFDPVTGTWWPKSE